MTAHEITNILLYHQYTGKIEEVFKKLIIMLKNCCNELEDMFFPKKLKENMNSKTLKFSN